MTALGAGATAAGKTTYGNALVAALAKDAPNPATAAQAIGLALQTEAAKSTATDTTITNAAITAAAQAGNTLVVTQGQNYYGPIVVAAQTAANAAGQAYFTNNAAGVVASLAAAGTDLANLVKTQIAGKGAKYVTVVNLPDVANTPYALANTADVRALVDKAVAAFNSSLAAGVSGNASILLVDAFSVNHDQIVNPAPYGLTNVKDHACDTTPAKNALGNSLGCTINNLVTGDVSHWLFADDVHPTPFGYKLLARYVSEKLVVNGWL
jgi:outer membrane lipase/esterase